MTENSVQMQTFPPKLSLSCKLNGKYIKKVVSVLRCIHQFITQKKRDVIED